VEPLTMFPGLDLIVSYASFRISTLVKISKALTYLPSGPCRRRERMIVAGVGLVDFIDKLIVGAHACPASWSFLHRLSLLMDSLVSSSRSLCPPPLTRALQPDV